MASRIEIHQYNRKGLENIPKVVHALDFVNDEQAAPHIPHIGGRVRYQGDRFRVTDIEWSYKQAGTLIIVEVEYFE